MNQQLQMLRIQTSQCKQFRVDNLINLLQFCEVVTAILSQHPGCLGLPTSFPT